MAYERLFDEDPLTGIRTTFVMEHGADDFKLVREQYLDPQLQNNLEQRNHREQTWKGDIHHCARIPNVVLEDFKRRGIDLINDQDELQKWLNDPDNSMFRTRQGKV